MEVVNVISWDVYGYYLYLPALLKYGDTSQYLFALDHINNYNVSTELYQVMDWNDSKAPIYTIGMAILYLPFYLLADLIAWIIPGIKADGMSPIYQWAIIIASWIYAGFGLYISDRVLRLLKIQGPIILLTLGMFFLGTSYFHYAAFENGMPHHFLFTLYIILIYVTIKWHQKPTLYYACVGGAVMAILCLARPSEFIALTIPLTYGIYHGLSYMIKFNKLWKYSNHLIWMIALSLVLVGIQMVFWKFNLDTWVFNGYQGHHFDWGNPHIIDGLFSFRKGWLVYSPLCLIGLVGIPVIWKYDKRWMLPVALFVIVNLYIVLSWHIWWYASSFGMRSLIQSYAVLIIPTAFAIRWSFSRTSSKCVMITIILLGIGLNQFQDWQYRNGILLQDEMNAAFYKKSFLKSTKDRDLRKLIDAPDIYPGKGSLITLDARENSFSWDTILPGSYGPTLRFPGLSLNTSKDISWLNVKAELNAIGTSFNNHEQARLVLAQKIGDENIKWTGVRFQTIMNGEVPLELTFDHKLALPIQENEIIESYVWNNGPDTILMRSIKVNYYK